MKHEQDKKKKKEATFLKEKANVHVELETRRQRSVLKRYSVRYSHKFCMCA